MNLNPHPPLKPRPLTAAAPRRRPAVTAPSEAAAPSGAATATAPPGMIRLNKSALLEVPINGLDAIKRLSKQHRSEQSMLTDQQPKPKQLSHIDDNDGDISPPPHIKATQDAARRHAAEARHLLEQNRYNRDNDRAALLESINSEPYMTQQGDVQVIMPQCRRPETVRSARLRSESRGEVGAVLGRDWTGFQKSNEIKNIGSLSGGKSRKNVRRRTVKRKRRLTRNKHRRANIRGTNRK